MNSDIILLQAKVDALRNYFTSLLPRIFDGDEQMVWGAKYYLWSYEREILSSLAIRMPASPEKARIDHRCFQLQVLMDVAYCLGNLEAKNIVRYIDPPSRAIALKVFQQSDGSEETMLPLIDLLK